MSWQPAPHLYGLEDKVAYTFEAHSWVPSKVVPWLKCRWCGLVKFRNPLTLKAIELGCNNRWHPQWRRFVKTLGSL